jgi:Ca2+-binding EF-hand superfamily protein
VTANPRGQTVASEDHTGQRPGTIDMSGFSRVMLDVFRGRNLAAHLMTRLFACFDLDGDGRLDFRELVLGCAKCFGSGAPSPVSLPPPPGSARQL